MGTVNNMSNIFKSHPLVTRIVIIAAVVGIVYLLIEHYSIGQYFVLGLQMFTGILHLPSMSDSSLLNQILIYFFHVVSLLAPGIIIGFLLLIAKQKRPFQLAFISTLFAYILLTIGTDLVFAFGSVAAYVGILTFVSMFIAYIVTRLLLSRVNNGFIILAIVAALVLISLLALPRLNSLIVRPIAQNNTAKELSAAVSKLEFTPYYPSYSPSGLALTPPKLTGYHSVLDDNVNVEYSAGRLEFKLAKALVNQDKVFNGATNCDISTIWFAMGSKSIIPQAKIDQSLDNLSICRVLGKTDSGYDVYAKTNKSQFAFYYMRVGDTIIVMDYDNLPKPGYGADIESEIFKIYNSMKRLDTSRITAGY